MPSLPLSRRALLRIMLLSGASLMVPSWLVGCSGGEEQAPLDEAADSLDSAISGLSDDASNDQANENSSTIETVMGFEAPILVAVYSATGHTRRVAQTIAQTLSAELWEITPETSYTTADLDYNNPDSRVSLEYATGGTSTSVPLQSDRPDGFASYHTVFIGYPIWFGEASWVVNNFITRNKFTGKTVVPFCTSASSPLGSSASNLAQRCGSGMWLGGQRFASDANLREVEQWVESNGYNHSM